MEATVINKSLSFNTALMDVAATFFKENDPESTKAFFWKIFQCWTLKDCKIKSEIADEELARFFDQLTDLVAVAYVLHQSNVVSQQGQEGAACD
jgi:hypothetical protein